MKSSDIWNWPGERAIPANRAMVVALIAGALLGALATGYVALLHWLPQTQAMMDEIAKASQHGANTIGWQLLLAVGLAPAAEEYFFRGLLFRALDREWGGWQAVVGSAAFFAIYHPPVSWLPVFCLGALSALLFKRSGRLLPCVILHMAYNLVVILAGQ